jgi:branched-chain amino acid transport system ATP-binding protein
MAIIATKNLTKQFAGVKAVDNLSFSIEKGLITGIIGPNGSGKTTLLHLLSGWLPWDDGYIIVNSEKITRIKTHEVADLGITRTFQDIRLFEQMTVLDNILIILTKKNIFNAFFERHTKIYQQKAEEVLKRVGLWEKKKELAGGLSYGQRKLLEIARALAMNAEIILLDEPFAGLFPQMVANISNLLKQLRTEHKTIILIEHNMPLIRSLCDQVYVLDSGVVLAHGDPEVVLNKKEVLAAYLGE